MTAWNIFGLNSERRWIDIGTSTGQSARQAVDRYKEIANLADWLNKYTLLKAEKPLSPVPPVKPLCKFEEFKKAYELCAAEDSDGYQTDRGSFKAGYLMAWNFLMEKHKTWCDSKEETLKEYNQKLHDMNTDLMGKNKELQDQILRLKEDCKNYSEALGYTQRLLQEEKTKVRIVGAANERLSKEEEENRKELCMLKAKLFMNSSYGKSAYPEVSPGFKPRLKNQEECSECSTLSVGSLRCSQCRQDVFQDVCQELLELRSQMTKIK